MKKMIFSQTGKVNGYGSDLYKWVSFLTVEERQIVRNESALVVVKADRLDGGNHGTYWRIVTFSRSSGQNRYNRRVPSKDELKLITSY